VGKQKQWKFYSNMEQIRRQPLTVTQLLTELLILANQKVPSFNQHANGVIVVLEVLFQNGISPDQHTPKTSSPLYVAAQKGRTKVVEGISIAWNFAYSV
jgi:hypothetical protein